MKRWLRRLRHRRQLRRLAGPRLLRAFAGAYPEAFFVEIGSNDGEQHDHLRPFILQGGWRGIMVEPVPYVFERLTRNYAAVEGVRLENVAIADHDGMLPFFYLEPREQNPRDDLPDWYDGIGSFSRDAVLSHRHAIPDIDSRLVESEIPSLTFESLCRRNSVDDVDLLLVDTEGYDWEILRSIDFAAAGPRLVIYEHYHLSREDREACLARLGEAGYETLEEGFDTFCLRPAEDELTSLWRRLSPAVPGVFAFEESR